MKETKAARIPEFRSLEEEREYWEARGPLAEGHKGRINKPKPGQRRSSFLAVRLTGEELTRLRDMAAKQGLGPSTFARLILTSAMRHESKLPKRVTWDELEDTLVESLPQSVREKVEALFAKVAIGEPNRTSLLVMDAGQIKEAEGLWRLLFRTLLSTAGIQVIPPEDERYGQVRDIVKTQT